MDVQEELEALRRTREQKVREIAEKRRHVEELRRRKAQKDAERNVSTEGMTAIQAQMAIANMKEKALEEEMGRSVDSLIAEILATPADAAARKVSVAQPLEELRRHASEAAARPCAGDRALGFQQELGVVANSFAPQCARIKYERASQTEMTCGEAQKEREEDVEFTSGNILMRMAEGTSDKAKTDVSVKGVASVWKSAGKQKAKLQEEFAAKQLTPEEREKLELSTDFQAFFEKTTLMVERTLGKQTCDLIADLAEDVPPEGDCEREPLRFLDEYAELKWTSRRCATDVRCSPHQRELFLAAYGARANPALSDAEGCLLVWNLAMRGRPELAFTCSSAVLTAQFHRYEPAIFFGGTQAGGVVLWDARAKREPVLRSPASGSRHTHPVQAMQQVGSRNASNLITASSDGRLCRWSTAMLSAPQESIDLKYESSKSRRELAVMSLSFTDGDTNTLYVGAEDGAVCQVHIHGQKSGITEMFEGHEGPVTGVHMHPTTDTQFSLTQSDAMKSLALSASFDWSVKLWDVKQHRHPILSFDCYEDYVCDAKWHPLHPATFAAVDCEGHVDLWNLCESVEAPAMRTENPGQRRLAMSHCDWSGDGRLLVTGDSEGAVSVFAADRSLTEPRGQDIVSFQEKVRQMRPVVPRRQAERH